MHDQPRWQWAEGTVDRTGDHFRLHRADSGDLVALVGPAIDTTYQVEFTIAPDTPENERALNEARSDIDLYFIELYSEDPWVYAQYRIGTAANVYAAVSWSWCPVGWEQLGDGASATEP